jgi:hypothetical protein
MQRLGCAAFKMCAYLAKMQNSSAVKNLQVHVQSVCSHVSQVRCVSTWLEWPAHSSLLLHLTFDMRETNHALCTLLQLSKS